MIAGFGVTKYRAVLGDETEREFAIVTVMDNGTISWATVDEDAFNESGCDDLPQDLYENVNALYISLQFSGAPVDD